MYREHCCLSEIEFLLYRFRFSNIRYKCRPHLYEKIMLLEDS